MVGFDVETQFRDGRSVAVQADLSVSTRQPAMQIVPFACRNDEILDRQAASCRVGP